MKFEGGPFFTFSLPGSGAHPSPRAVTPLLLDF